MVTRPAMQRLAQEMAGAIGGGDLGIAQALFVAVLSQTSGCDVRWNPGVFEDARNIAPIIRSAIRASGAPAGTWFVWGVARIELLPDGWPPGKWAVVLIGADCSSGKERHGRRDIQ